MAPFGDGVGLVARNELRRRWLALLGLALLVAFVGAVSLSGFAGARRTTSALDRFRDATLARDARVVSSNDELTHELATALADEPWVAAASEFAHYFTNTDDFVGVTVYAGDAAFATQVDRPVVLDGRMPADDAPNEVAIDEVARDSLDLGVGDVLHLRTYQPEDLQCYLTSECPFQGIPGPDLDLDVVGVMRDVDAFATTEDPTPSVTASVAFRDEYRDQVGAIRSEVAVRMEDPDDLDRLDTFIEDRTDEAALITPEDDYASGAADAVDVSSTALLVFALISALAGAFAVFQAVGRQVDAAAQTTRPLPALGFTRWGWARAAALPTIVAIAAGAVLAGIVAAAASGIFPIGLADRLEPEPGLRLDPLVLLGGVLVIGVAAGGWAMVSARVRCAQREERRSWAPQAKWAPLTVAAGARLAFGRGRTRTAGPMRSAMVGIAVGTIGAIASTFVLVSLHDLIDDPGRWGVTWDGVGGVGDPTLLQPTVDQLTDDDEIAAVATLDQGLIQVDSTDVNAYAFTPVVGSIEPTLVRGRLPDGEDEIALGEVTMRELDVDVGDTLAADDGDDEGQVDLDVVGAVALPAYNDLRPGQGSVLTPEGLEPVNQATQDQRILLRYEDDVDPDDIEERLGTDYALGLLPPITPPQLSNLDESTVVIRALVAFFLALAVVGLAQALVLSIRRQRASVAVWRVLGFVPRQVRAAILWQAALVVAVAVAVGVPLGLYVGHVAWRLTVQNLGVIDDPTLPVVPASVALPVALLAALLIAALPAWLAARGEPAEALHAE